MYISKLRQILFIQYLIGWFVVVAEGRGSIWRAGLACRERPHVVQTSPPDQLGQVWISLSVYIRIYPYISVYIYIPWHNIGITCCILPSSGYNSICVHFGKFVPQTEMLAICKFGPCQDDGARCWLSCCSFKRVMLPSGWRAAAEQRQPLGQQWCSKVGILLGGLYTNVLGLHTMAPQPRDLQHLRWKGVVAQAAVWGGDDRPWCQGVGAAEEEDWAALATSL